jgi:hypothetical protein
VSHVYAYVLGRSDDFARVDVPTSVTIIGCLENLLHRFLRIEFTGIGPSGFHLRLLPPRTEPGALASVVVAGGTMRLERTATLGAVGVTTGARIVAVLRPDTDAARVDHGGTGAIPREYHHIV